MNWYSLYNIAEHFELNFDWLENMTYKCDILPRTYTDDIVLAENQVQILIDKLDSSGYIKNTQLEE